MKRTFRAGRGVLAAGVVTWRRGLFRPFGFRRPQNSLMVLAPYEYGTLPVPPRCAEGTVREAGAEERSANSPVRRR